MKNLRKLNIIITSILLIFTCFSFRVNVEAEEIEEVASFNESVTVDDVTVTVSAPEGVFPAGAVLSVEKVYDSSVEEAVGEIRDNYQNVVETFSFDIKVLDEQGNEIQPNETVKVSFAYNTNANNNLDTNIYHLDEELNVEKLDVDVIDDVATVETDSFSIYTVEFTYDSKQYVMDGNTSVKLSDILDYVGLTGNIENVVVSNTELVSAEEVDGEWMIHSHQPFTSNEWMKVTLDGVEYEIRLTDAFVTGWNFGTNMYAWIDSLSDGTYKLVIRPSSGGGGDTGSGTLGASKTTASAWPWYNKTDSSGALYTDKIKEVEFRGTVTMEQGKTYAYMFANFKALEKINFEGSNGTPGLVTEKAGSIEHMFNGCTSLKSIDMSYLTNDGRLWGLNSLFRNCSALEEVKLSNPNFKTRDGSTAPGGVNLSNMFDGCDNLKKVDFSETTFGGRAADDWKQFSELFKNKTNLEEVNLKNTKVPGMRNFSSMFEGCTSLTTVNMEGFTPSDARYMTAMFKDCTSLTDLDVSSFGTLHEIINMDDFVAGDQALVTLNIDNLDNSFIQPTNSKHSITEGNIPGAREYGREIFGLGVYDVKRVFTNLETISAKNGTIWLCKNISGNPGNEYYNVSEGSEIVYLAKGKQIKLNDITLETQRDYIDVITDRDDGENKHAINVDIELPDKDKNINIVNNDLNTNGPGFLAPGVYTFTDDDWKELEHAPMDDTYYRISYIGAAPYKVIIDDKEIGDGTQRIGDLVIVQGNHNTYINTDIKNDWPTEGNVEITNKIEIVYEDAAIDVNGKKHDVIMTINSITFKDLQLIPKDSNRIHDDNKYYDTDGRGSYYRTILQATEDQGIIFRNYVMISDPTNPWPNKDIKALSGGSGTDIDFNIRIDGANDDTSFVFYVDDLDVAEYQNWVRPNTSDACYDYLPVGNVTYGAGGEGFKLNSGNLSDPKFAPHTGLAYVDEQVKQVITTGSDPNTPWSEFTVKTDAKAGGNYTWTSGVACTTYVLKNTAKLSLGEIELDLQATKKLLGDTLQAGQFDFKLEPDNAVSDNKATDSARVTNGADGIIKLLKKTFDPDNKVTIDNLDYYPGTNPDGNTHGDGVHNKYVYAYIVKEIEGNGTDIKYDKTEHKLRIEISTPENDAEMTKGIKADIFVDGTLVKTVWSKDRDKTVNKVTFTNKKVLKLTVSNELIGPDADPDKEFTFTVTADDGTTKTFKLKGGETSEVIELVAGTNYTITQADYSEDGYLTKVGDEKKLVVTGTISTQTDVKFTNIKKPFIDPPVKKTVSGDKPDSDGLFTFEIIGLDNAPMPAGSKGNSKKVTITGADEFEFGNIYFEDPGVYTYTIREVNNGVNGYTYDDSVYQIEVEIDEGYNAIKTVTKNGEPYMSDDEVVVFVFDNVYKKDSKPQRKTYVIPKTGIE